MKNLFVKRGFVQEFIDRDARRLPKEDGFYDLQKWFKRVLNYLHIPYLDPCCDTTKTTSPVQYNSDGTTLEIFNLETNEWESVSVSAAPIVPNWTNVTANATVPVTQHYTSVNATTANVLLIIPTPALASGVYTFKKTDASVHTVTFSQSIDGNASFALNDQYESVSILSNGSAYYIL